MIVTLIESEDMETSSARDTILSESTLPLPTTADTGNSILLNEISSDCSKYELQHESKENESMKNHTLSESQERQEIGDREGIGRMEGILSEDVFTTAGHVANQIMNGELDSKKKPKEPPGTPCKYERNISKTADEREQRIKDCSNYHEKELSQLDKRQVNETLLDEGIGINGMQWDDKISIQREPSGSIMTLNTFLSDNLERNNDKGNLSTNIIKERANKMPPIKVDKVE